MDGAPVLVAQLEIRNRVARRGHVIEDHGLVVGLGLRNHDDVVQQHVGIGVLRNQHIGGDGVAGVQFAQDARDP